MPELNSVSVKKPSYSNEAVFRLAMQNYEGSTAKRVIFAGDSNTMGLYAGTGYKGLVGARANSYPVLVANELGWQDGSFFGDQNVVFIAEGNATISDYDPRLNFGSFGVLGVAGIYGKFITCSGASVTDLTFTPTQSFDKIKLWLVGTTTSSNDVKLKVDGSIVATINTVKSGFTYYSYDHTVAKGLHSLAIENDGAGIAYIVGIETWDSTNANPRLLISGSGGASSNMFSANDPAFPWVGLQFLKNMGADAVVFNCLINDIESSRTFDQTITDWRLIVKELQLVNCDVALTIPFSWGNAKVYDGTVDNYANWMKRTATAYGTAFADYRFATGGDSTTANNLGLINPDLWHPNTAGYVEIAKLAKWIFKK